MSVRPGRAHQLGRLPAQDLLPGHGLLVSGDDAGHAQHDQEEHDPGDAGDYGGVHGLAHRRLDEQPDRGDEGDGAEQGQAGTAREQGRQPAGAPTAPASTGAGRPPPSSCRRRSTRGRTGCRRASSSRVQAGQAVDRVGHQRPQGPDGQQPPGGVAQPPGAPEVGQHGQQQDVAQWVGGRRQTDEHPSRGPDVGTDQEDPRQQPEAQGDDEGVEQAGLVATGQSGPHEQEQPDGQDRVHGDVDGVDERRERDVLLAHYLVPGLVNRVPGDEKGDAGADEPPGQRWPWAGSGGRRRRWRPPTTAPAPHQAGTCPSHSIQGMKPSMRGLPEGIPKGK